MFRFLLRLCGMLVLAGGFVAGVIDGARSIANDSLQLTSVADAGLRMFGDRFLQLQPTVERQLHPLLWDPVLVHILRAPAIAVAFALGTILLWLARPRPEPIGYRAGR